MLSSWNQDSGRQRSSGVSEPSSEPWGPSIFGETFFVYLHPLGLARQSSAGPGWRAPARSTRIGPGASTKKPGRSPAHSFPSELCPDGQHKRNCTKSVSNLLCVILDDNSANFDKPRLPESFPARLCVARTFCGLELLAPQYWASLRTNRASRLIH